jgi:hypothetical protein
MDRNVVVMAELAEVVERGRTAERPMLDVVGVAMRAGSATWEAAAAVADPQRSLDGGWNGARAATDVEHASACVDVGDHQACIAGQA